MPRWLKLTLAAMAVILAALYFTGRLDYALYPVGLNFHACGRNGFGATFCGSDLTAYKNRIRGVQQQIQTTEQSITRQQQAVEQQFQNAQRTITQQECQADPQLTMCTSP